jgi:hypothetical protein
MGVLRWQASLRFVEAVLDTLSASLKPSFLTREACRVIVALDITAGVIGVDWMKGKSARKNRS